jgi:hypothetical protein
MFVLRRKPTFWFTPTVSIASSPKGLSSVVLDAELSLFDDED